MNDLAERVMQEVGSTISFAFSPWREAGQAMIAVVQSIEVAFTRPSAVYKPKVYLDGDQWCALYGEDIQVGVCGFGPTPEAAMAAFDQAWRMP